MTTVLTFPRGFSFGTATAAYQIEGAVHEDGRRDSIWDAYCRVPGAIANGDNGDVACDHYHRMPSDVALMAELGLDTYRFSTSWARVRPDDGPTNPAGVDFYSRLVDELLTHGIRPWLTLYHWDLPQALEDRGGWRARDTVHRYCDYATAVAGALGDRVRHWMLFNEPLNIVISGYVTGAMAPARRSLIAYFAALHQVNLATGLGSRALRAADPDAVVGTTQYLSPPIGSGPGRLAGVAERAADAVLNRAFLEPLLGLGYPWRAAPLLLGVRPFMRDDDEDAVRADLDFLGVQYYTRLRAPFVPIPGLWTSPHFGGVSFGNEVTSLGWEILPEGLGMALDQVHSYGAFGRIVVTEGGASFPGERVVAGRVHDARRIDYYQRHLAEVAAARARGVPVDGYFAWSLLDNFEWAEGFEPRFGLVHVDFATQERTIKDSGYWFAGQLGGSARPPS